MKKLTLVVALIAVAGCRPQDPNLIPEYGKESGLPANCRAFIQYAVDSYRAKQYTADATFASIERNCGANGILWRDMANR